MTPLIQLTTSVHVATERIGHGLTVILLVTILLCLQGCGRPKPMDAIWSTQPVVDHNGLARNPVWAWQKQTGQAPDPCSFCPCDKEDGQSWNSAANCTDALPEVSSSTLCFGHWNWYPVEYEGIVTWDGHSNSVYDDDDYELYIKRDDQALETAGSRKGVELEFDSDETVDYWDDTNTWWDDFHHNYVDNSDEAAHGRIDGKFAIIVGLLGLDSQHGVHSELHPVYAMFVHVQDDPTQDKWAFFVRNWGDEGFCGNDDEFAYFPGTRLRVLIPHSGPPRSVGQNVWVYGDNEDEFNQQTWTFQNTNEGLLLNFNLQDPSKKDGFVGDLTISWGGTILAASPRPAPAATALGKSFRSVTKQEDEDVVLKEKFDKLDPATQKLLVKQLKSLTHHPAAKPKPGTLSTEPLSERPQPTGKSPAYAIVKSVPDKASEARKAQRREAALAFFKAHGVD